MLLPARGERLATSLNRTVSGNTFPTLSSLDKPVGIPVSLTVDRLKGSVQMEQRINLKFLVKLGKTFTDAYVMLKKVYGNECLCRMQVFDVWRLKERRETTEDDLRPGRPSMLKTD
ncbi:hypothetical protein NQ318_014518 [Aromia moschata]|uniref:Uncharacterized protein n=1 Tax=Aromia moschata TaxID=1265417 RepID=A0AAV8YNX3_9CUCU|nr:hypothetical protein NQ318_014518 [Aromia moschata]